MKRPVFSILAVLLALFAEATTPPTCVAESKASSVIFIPFDNAELTLFITLPTTPPFSAISAPILAPRKAV